MSVRTSLAALLGLIMASGCAASTGDPYDPFVGDDMTDGPLPPDSDSGQGATTADAVAEGNQGSGRGADATTEAGGDAGGMTSVGHDADAVDVGTVDTGSAVADASSADTGSSTGDPETGRLVGITAAHNAVRAKVQTQPPLPPLTWSTTLADYAQQWATSLAGSTSGCAAPMHRSSSDLQSKDYGENLAAFSGGGLFGGGGSVSTAEQAVNDWAAEEMCWTYGTIAGTEQCNTTCYTNLHSDGCGHYTQIVWRGSMQLGCGVATCKNGSATEDIWICNYAPAGNIIGQAPY